MPDNRTKPANGHTIIAPAHTGIVLWQFIEVTVLFFKTTSHCDKMSQVNEWILERLLMTILENIVVVFYALHY